MAREATDRKLQMLREAIERIGQNLVELETDSNRQLLEASKLSGQSADLWASASAKLTDLWQWNSLLQGHLEQATKLRDAKRFDELDALLDGPSIELSTTDVPLAQRTLLGDSEVAERCSAADLIRRMSAAFDQVKTVVARVGGAWETLIPQLDTVRRQMAECQQLAAELGEGGRTDLESAAHELSDLSAAVTSDPLSVAPARLQALTRSLADIRADLDSIAEIKREFDARVAAARELAAGLRALADEGRAAHEELLVKIATPTAPPALELREDPGAELGRISDLGRQGAWRDARRELDEWTTRTNALIEDGRRIVRANRAPIEERNQMRALLDAYQVKAKALGLIEDPALVEVFAQARDALYTAPTDLAAVGRLVRRYQQTLNGTPATEGELR
jgi:hypothetical protein